MWAFMEGVSRVRFSSVPHTRWYRVCTVHASRFPGKTPLYYTPDFSHAGARSVFQSCVNPAGGATRVRSRNEIEFCCTSRHGRCVLLQRALVLSARTIRIGNRGTSEEYNRTQRPAPRLCLWPPVHHSLTLALKTRSVHYLVHFFGHLSLSSHVSSSIRSRTFITAAERQSRHLPLSALYAHCISVLLSARMRRRPPVRP